MEEPWVMGAMLSGFQRTLETARHLCFRYVSLIRKEKNKIYYFHVLSWVGFALSKKKFLLLQARIKESLKLL